MDETLEKETELILVVVSSWDFAVVKCLAVNKDAQAWSFSQPYFALHDSIQVLWLRVSRGVSPVDKFFSFTLYRSKRVLVRCTLATYCLKFTLRQQSPVLQAPLAQKERGLLDAVLCTPPASGGC